MKPGDRVYVAGHGGLVGSALVRALGERGYGEVLTASRQDVDLRDASDVGRFFRDTRPTHVFMAAAKVGGIWANDTYPADFLEENLAIELNVLSTARRHGVEKLLFLGSSCIYPREAPQPLREDALLTGPLEPTNEWYAVAKIAGIKLCQAYRKQHGANFISAMPTNLYGPGDNFDPETSHVLPALLRRFHEAAEAGDEEVVVWGTGTPRREFLHVDDLADACLLLMDRYDEADIINVGTGEDISIRELAALMARVTGYEGRIVFDPSRPDGTPRKVMDVGRIRTLGWSPSISLEDGVRATFAWYLENGVERTASA